MSETKLITEQTFTDLKVQSQINRLNKSLSCLRDQDVEIMINFGNSPLGKEIERLRKMIGDQWSVIEKFKVMDFADELDTVLDQNRQDARLNRLHQERKILTDEIEELNNAFSDVKKKQIKLSEQLQLAKTERFVLEHILMKSTCDNNNQNIVNSPTADEICNLTARSF